MCSSPPFKSYKKKSFVDSFSIQLSSGKGGRGAVHFQRTRRSLRAGPDGGDGGDGGDLTLAPKSDLRDFSHLKSRVCYKAGDGKPGQGDKKKGAKGQNLTLYVPKDTICYDLTGQKLKELKDKSWCVLKGGKGGKGNHFFKSSRQQAPQFAQPGQSGLKKTLTLKLKTSPILPRQIKRKKDYSVKSTLGVFGASFNPPHLGHLNLLVQVQKQFNFDLIKVVPTFQNPLLSPQVEVSPLKKLALVHKVFKSFSFVEVDDREIKRKGVSYTIDTIKSLEKECPFKEIFLIMGLDQWAKFDKWKNFKTLLKKTHLVVCSRKGYEWEKSSPLFFKKYVSNKNLPFAEYKSPQAGNKNIYWLSLKDKEVSSSQIRELASQKKAVDHLVPSLVDQWIKRENPYLLSQETSVRAEDKGSASMGIESELDKKEDKGSVGLEGSASMGIESELDKKEDKGSVGLEGSASISQVLKHKNSKIIQFFAEVLLEKKAQKVRTFDLTGFPKIPFDFTVVASGLNPLHTRALATYLQKQVKKRFLFSAKALEGQETGEWIVLDYGALVVHIFYDYKREYYRLEDLWSEAPQKDFSSDF